MRILILFSFLIISSIGCLSGQSSTIEDALTFYNKKEYGKAINIYNDLLPENPSATLLYNLANSYQENGNHTLAILNYEKALLLQPGNSDILHNLQIANEQIENPINKINNFFLSTGYWNIVHSFHSTFFSILLLVLLFLILLFTYFILFKSNDFWAKRKFHLLIPTILLSILVYTMLRQRSVIENGSHLIITTPATMYSGIDERSQSLQDIDPGIKAQLLDSLEAWYKISLPDMEQGWVKKEKVAIIK